MNEELQKSANTQTEGELPKEILNPFKAAQQYDLRMYQPCEQLADFVDEYWVLYWDMRDKQPFVCEVIPSPYINLTFMQEGSRITGVTTGKYTYEITGKGKIVGVKFKPGGFRPFWHGSMSDFTDEVAPASQIFEAITSEYNQKILDQPIDEKAIAEIEELLLGQMPIVDDDISLVGQVINSLADDRLVTVGSVASQFGMSERALQQLFHDYVGVGVKWIILRSRLQRAAGLAAKLESPNWTEIANELGYSDQSHFVNDFKRIIGKSPKQYSSSQARRPA